MKKPPSENIILTFSKYLKSNGLRQTSERFAILSEIYLSDEHFDLQSLGERLNKKRFFVSRGTLYNTVNLLLDCSLIQRYSLGGHKSVFQKTKNIELHDHLILTDTKEVLEFSDEQLSAIQKNVEQMFNVDIHSHSLIFYGKRKTIINEQN
ncbi:MAG: transcriptional repressor [Bacteroidales bacterium]|jgi:Fur family ferric uptake transcriptional regulator|nr:transcriptional repressor [Bacteroidales bacterium]